MECFSGPVERVFAEGRTYYRCDACNKISARSIVIDNGITWWISEQGTYFHESVGVLVMNEKKELLCLLRSIYPFVYSIPSGHLDAGELPMNAAIRELEEETGLVPTANIELIAEYDLHGDSCRRGSDDHRWHLYRTLVTGQPTIHLSDEASHFKWVGVDEVSSMDNASFPLRYIVDTFAPVF